MLSKNSVLKVKIESVSGDGQGVARVDGQVVFVPYTAVNDEVEIVIIKVTKTYAVGKVQKLLTPSSCRIDIDCEAFLKCGGCAFRHLTLDEEQRIKTQSVKDAMRRIGGIDVEVKDAILTPYTAYRNKAQLPVAEDEKGLKCGFFAPYSHRIVDKTLDCLATPEIFSDIARMTLDFMRKEHISGYCEEKHTGLVRHLYMRINKEGRVMLCLVVNGKALVSRETEKRFADYITSAFPEIVSVFVNENSRVTNAVLGDSFRLIFGQDYLEDELLGVKLRMSPDSFFQVNREGAETVYKTAFSLLEGKRFENVYDLYCGVGSIGLSLFSEIKNGNLNVSAERLFGIEIVEKAAEWARRNAEANGIEDCDFAAADSSDITEMDWFDKYPPSLVILDPPRKGTTERLLKYLSDKGVSDILYISCNPTTLARDMSYLYSLGYSASFVVPVNLFPRTSHVESVVLLSRKDVHERIKFDVNVEELMENSN